MSVEIPKGIQLAIENAANSTTRKKVGAALKHGKFYYNGSSDWNRQVVAKRKVGMTICAERSAMFVNRHARILRSNLLAVNRSPVQRGVRRFKLPKLREKSSSKNKRPRKLLYEGWTMYVARVIFRADGTIDLKNSKPCATCLYWMMMYGITDVCYTTGNPEMPVRTISVKYLAEEPLYYPPSTTTKANLS